MTKPAIPVWLSLRRGQAPLVVSIPHAGTDLVDVAPRLESLWLARLDADWWVDRLYAFASELDATIISTAISRTVIDVNRDPQSRSLYPGMATTQLVPTTTFDGVGLYTAGSEPDDEEQALRRERYYMPYHSLLRSELARLQQCHRTVVLYDAHSIRSRVPRLFDGELPLFNIGTYDGRSCDAQLANAVAETCQEFAADFVVNGRFKGGAITRTYGAPARGIQALQMELACRAYLDEPAATLSEHNWPPAYDEQRAAPVQRVLRDVLERCLEFSRSRPR